jgi:hypothetical protein
MKPVFLSVVLNDFFQQPQETGVIKTSSDKAKLMPRAVKLQCSPPPLKEDPFHFCLGHQNSRLSGL